MKKKLKIFYAGLIILILFSCRSTKKEKSSIQFNSELSYTCIIEQKGNGVQQAKNQLSAHVAQILADYAFGISYTLNGRIVKTYVKAEISQAGKEAVQTAKNIKGRTFLIETGRFRYDSPVILNYRAKYDLNMTKSGDDFWKVYNKMIIEAIQSRVKTDSQGIVLPQRSLEAKLDENGLVTVTSDLVVFIL